MNCHKNVNWSKFIWQYLIGSKKGEITLNLNEVHEFHLEFTGQEAQPSYFAITGLILNQY